jgi:hypothetical protein
MERNENSQADGPDSFIHRAIRRLPTTPIPSSAGLHHLAASVPEIEAPSYCRLRNLHCVDELRVSLSLE